MTELPESTQDEDIVVIGHDDISNYNPAQILPEPPESLRKIRRWLRATDYAHASGEFRKHLTSHMPGTGLWLTSSATFRQWLAETGHATLWIKGIPGSGKSVIAAHLIDCLAARYPGQPVLYFFFRQIIDANHEPKALLRDWLDQILEYSPPLQKELKLLIDSGRSLQSLSMEDLWSHLRLATQELAGHTFCIADALDEMDQGNDEFLQSLTNFGAGTQGKAKVVLTSRPTPLIETSLRPLSILRLHLEEDLVDADIANFVESCLRSSQLSPTDQDIVRKAVPGHANGIFLYAKLAMDSFLEPGASAEAVVQVLPVDLHAMYARLLQEHGRRCGVPSDVQLLILQWVTHSTRPLRLLELAEVVRTNYLCNGGLRGAMDLTAAKDLIRVAVGPLLGILPNETICVIHHSFTEYLKSATRPGNDGEHAVLRLGATHGRLALACLDYLQAGCLDSIATISKGNENHKRYKTANYMRKINSSISSDSSLNREDQRVRLQYPLYAYAAANWHLHVKRSCSAEFLQTDINAALQQFFSNKKSVQAWLRFHWVSIGEASNGTGEASTGITPLHIAARFGLTELAKHLHICRGTDVDATDMHGRTPLWWAATAGHADTIRYLITAGANLANSAYKIRSLSPLIEAASNNHADAVRVLLTALVNPLKSEENHERLRGIAPKARAHTALMYACTRGHLETLEVFLPFFTGVEIAHSALAWSASSARSKLVQRLLRYPGVSANASVERDSILHRACKQLDRDSVLALLKAGADPMKFSNETNGGFTGNGQRQTIGSNQVTPEERGYTALHALCDAIRRGRRMAKTADASVLQDIFEALLAAGVSVDFRMPSGRTALHAAVDSPILTRLLILSGADANIADDRGRTPLHDAVLPTTIALLVEEGHANINQIMPPEGTTALLITLSRNASDASLKLLEYHPDMAIKDFNGKGPLHIALSSHLVQVSLVRALLEAGADPNERDRSGQSPLLANRLNSRQAIAIIDVLLSYGAEINARNRSGISLLARASRYEQFDYTTIRQLLDRGADLHVRDFKGKSLLHHAVASCNVFGSMAMEKHEHSRLDYLVSLGLDPRCTDYRGNTLLHELALRSDIFNPHLAAGFVSLLHHLLALDLSLSQGNHHGRTVLHILSAARLQRDGSTSTSVTFSLSGPLDFVISRCRDIDQCDVDGLTALHLASTVSESICKKLLSAGADPLRSTNDGLNALHLAARARQSNIVGLLIQSCPVSSKRLVDARDAKGNTPLYYACRAGVPGSVRLLIDACADATNKDLWLACMAFGDEQKLWIQDRHPADHETNGAAGGLTLDDKTRPGALPDEPEWRSDLCDHVTRLEEITEMLAVNACDKAGLFAAVENPRRGDRSEAVASNSNYALVCLTKACNKMLDHEEHSYERFKSSSERFAKLQQAALKSAIADEVRKHGQNGAAWLVEHLLKAREYDILVSMAEEGFRFWDPEQNIVHLELLTRHGYSALLEKIGTIEAQRLLEGGSWHALDDKSTPGLFNGSPPSQKSGNSITSKVTFLLHVAVQRPSPNMDVVRILVENFHVDVNEYCYALGRKNSEMVQQHTVLHELAHGYHWWQVALAIPYLVANGADVNAKDQNGRTPLQIALGGPDVCVGVFHKDAARCLVASGANIDAHDDNGLSCLASTGGDLEMIRILLDHNVQIEADAIFAVLSSLRVDALQALLGAGADPNGRRESSTLSIPASYRWSRPKGDGDVPLSEQYPLHFVSTECRVLSLSGSKIRKMEQWSNAAELMQMLLSAGADPMSTFYRWTPSDIEEEDAPCEEDESVKELLRDGRATKRTLEEATLTHDLIDQNEMIHPILVLDQLDADHRDARGRNLIHVVCHHYNLDAPIDSLFATVEDNYKSSMPSFMDCLCAHGANPLAVDLLGNNILHHMFLSNNRRKTDDNDRLTIMRLANLYPNLVDQVNNQGSSPLQMALKHVTLHNTTEAAEALLDAGANPLIRDHNGNSGLHILAFSLYFSAKSRALFSKLLHRGLDINARNKRGESPIFNLNKHLPWSRHVSKELIGAAEALLIFERAGADMFAQDDSGRNLLHIAAKETQEPTKRNHYKGIVPFRLPKEPSIVRFQALLAKGLDPLAEDLRKRTALDVAAACGKKSILKLFDRRNV